MIEVKNLLKKFGKIDVLRDISFKVNNNLLAVLGPSGSGKTTLLRLIAGLEVPDKGEILIDGQVVSTSFKIVVPPYKRNLSMIFQNLSLWPHMTVQQHLEFVSKDNKKIEDILCKLKLIKLKERYPYQLSGGERQRLAIARALVVEPSYLLMDEPFSHLDFSLKKEMISLLLDLRKNLDITIIYVTHNLDEAMALADFVILMENGTVLFYGSKKNFFENYSTLFNLK